MLTAAQFLAFALTSTQSVVTPGIQLAGRPTTFDYQTRAQPSKEWVDAVIHKIDRRASAVTVQSRSAGQAVITFAVEDHEDLTAHRIGDVIKIRLSRDGDGFAVRHVDR